MNSCSAVSGCTMSGTGRMKKKEPDCMLDGNEVAHHVRKAMDDYFRDPMVKISCAVYDR